MELSQLLSQITPDNHDEICAGLREDMPDESFATLEFAGILCVSDGTNLVEKKLTGKSLGDPDGQPRIIPLPEGFTPNIINNSYLENLENISILTATLGCPISDLAIWVRCILIKNGKSILDSSEELTHAFSFCLQRIMQLDIDSSWFANACLHYCSASTGVSFEQVAEEFGAMSDKEAADFLTNTGALLGFSISQDK